MPLSIDIQDWSDEEIGSGLQASSSIFKAAIKNGCSSSRIAEALHGHFIAAAACRLSQSIPVN
jgi:hypothetical protein